MVWSKRERTAEHGRRSMALTAAYQSPAGMPCYDRAGMARGSRGGAPIWVMREAFMSDWSDGKRGHWDRKRKHGVPSATGIATGNGEATDPDGFAVFGRYPKGFLDYVIKSRLLGDVGRDDILHVCSGTLGPDEKWTVDIRTEAKPRIVASGTALPFKDATFKAVMIDPPYSDQHARNLYKTENPRPSWILKEAARVVQPCGRIGILHVAVPFSPPACRLVNVWGVSTGVGFRIRAFTVYEREQKGLF